MPSPTSEAASASAASAAPPVAQPAPRRWPDASRTTPHASSAPGRCQSGNGSCMHRRERCDVVRCDSATGRLTIGIGRGSRLPIASLLLCPQAAAACTRSTASLEEEAHVVSTPEAERCTPDKTGGYDTAAHLPVALVRCRPSHGGRISCLQGYARCWTRKRRRPRRRSG